MVLVIGPSRVVESGKGTLKGNNDARKRRWPRAGGAAERGGGALARYARGLFLRNAHRVAVCREPRRGEHGGERGRHSFAVVATLQLGA